MAESQADSSTGSKHESNYTNLAFDKDEHQYGKVTSKPSEKRLEGTTSCGLCNKRAILLISSLIFIAIVVAVVVAVVILKRDKDAVSSLEEEGIQWGEWSECSITCGIGVRQRSRLCRNIESSGCSQYFQQTEECVMRNCAEESFWSSWGEWTGCTVSCGFGFQTRYRRCLSVVSSRCVGEYVQTDVCNAGDCPGRGRWTTWTGWGSCDVTCGGGQKIRTRDCLKNVKADIDCVGEENQQTQCNEFQCPDCSQKCDVGQLNQECTACVCLGNIVRGRIRSAETGNAIGNAAFYDKMAPTRVLALSNNTGSFQVTAVCSTTSLLVKRYGYLDLTTPISDSFLELRMESTVHPYLTDTPQSTAKLAGEDIMLCCRAEGKPGITYYEWFKDKILISQMQNLDNNGTSIVLANVSSNDSGSYQCRANNEVGSIISEPAIVTIKDSPDHFCTDALRPKSIDLPGDCVQTTYEVGQCVTKSCRRSSANDSLQCNEYTDSCCTVSDSRIDLVNCTGYSLDIIVTVSCGCEKCQEEDLIISGLVLGLDTNDPIRFATVKMNGKVSTSTSLFGRFKIITPKNIQNLVLSIEDYNQEYLPTTKTIELSDGLGGLLNVEIKMIPVPEPQILDSTVDNNLFAGFINDSTPKVELALAADSFFYANGSKYRGKINAKLTYLDPTNLSNYDNIPGTFQFINEEGVQRDLNTLGVFNMILESEDGQRLQVNEAIDAYIPGEIGNLDLIDNFKLWSLNPKSGLWEDATVFQPTQRRKRSKRETAKWIGQLEDVSERKWYNYDNVSYISPNKCFFRVRLYKTPLLQQTEDRPERPIRLRIHIKRGEILHSTRYTISFPFSDVVNTVCDGDEALIEADTEVNNGLYKLYVSSPSPPVNTNFSKIASDEKSIKIRLIASPSGPFFNNRSDACSAKNVYLPFFYGIKNGTSWVYNENPASEANCTNSDSSFNYLRFYTRIPGASSVRVCMVKVKIELSTNANINKAADVKLRVTSSTFSKVVGVHEWILSLSETKTSETVCVEYRCSGNNDPCKYQEYYTHVKIAVEHNIPSLTFSVKQQAEGLTNTTCGDYVNTDQTSRADEAFEFCAPVTLGNVESGLYTDKDDEIGNARTLAFRFCQVSKFDVSNNGIPQPDIGVAVTFQGK